MNSYRDQLLTVEDANSVDRVPDMGPGALLKKKREEMSLSYDQIAQTTKIRPHILQALEEEDWNSLPSSPFVRGFIRSYARSLGLNEDVVADAYREISEEMVVPTEVERKPARRKKGKALYIFSVLILLAGLFFLFTNGEQIWEGISNTAGKEAERISPDIQPRKVEDLHEGENPASTDSQVAAPIKPTASSKDSSPQSSSELEIKEGKTEQPEESPTAPAETVPLSEAAPLPDEAVVMNEETTRPATETSSLTPTLSTVPSEKGLVLKANVKERTWIRVFVDKMKPKDYVFSPGSKPEWTAEKGFELLIGNAGGIELGFEGAPMKTPGKKGQVIRLSIPEGYERSKNN